MKAFGGLKPHDHICLIYETSKDWEDAVVPFLKIGLERGEKCLYVVDSHTANQIHHFLKKEGIDVESVKQSGQLVILHESEAYTRDGSFDPDRMIALLISETEKALSEGYPALRITGEMTWVLKGHPGSEKLIEYEAKLNSDLFPKYPCVAICQYNRQRFNPEIIKGVILTHPIVIWGKQLYENIYYIPPEEVLSNQYAERQVEHWLNTLERERRTRRNREFLANVIDRSSQPMSLKSPDGRLLLFNKAFLTLLGYEKSELSKLRWNKHLTPPEWLPGELELLEELQRKGKPIRCEKEYLRKDGSRVPVELLVELTQDDEGKPLYLAFITDISERKRTEEELKKYRDQLEGLVRQMTREIGDAGWKYRTVADFTYDWEDWSNPDGSFVYVSPSCERISGHRPQEFIERPYLFREIIVAEDRVFWDQHFSEVRHQLKPGETQFRIRRRDGKICWIEHACQPIKDAAQNVIGFRASNRDITDRKLLEQKIQRSAEEWQTTFDSIQDPIMVLDPEFRILRINASTRSFLGLLDDQILGACCYELVHGTEGCIPECPVRTMLTSKHHEEKEVYEPWRGIWFHITADPLLGPSGSLIGIVHTLKDITPRRKAEEDLQQLQEELRRVTRIATMGELTAALAHELNQPLTGILSNAQAAQRFLSSQNPDLTELREILSDIVEDDQRASDVILKLRSLFKKEVFQFEMLNMNDVITEIVPMIRSHALLKGVLFVTELDPDILPVKGDRIQLQQVLLNLAFNGFEAMEHSEVKKLCVRTKQDAGEWVRVSVKDSGTGVDEKRKEEIFKPFFTTKEDGMGIGLVVSHSIIALHQGRIWIENNPDQGSTVSFTVPVAEKTST